MLTALRYRMHFIEQRENHRKCPSWRPIALYTGVSDAKKQSSPRAHPGCYGGGCVTSHSDAAYSRLRAGCTMARVDGSHTVCMFIAAFISQTNHPQPSGRTHMRQVEGLRGANKKRGVGKS